MSHYSPQCQPIADTIKGLKKEVASFQKQLRKAAPGAKAPLISQIEKLEAKIAIDREQLEACVKKHPYHPN